MKRLILAFAVVPLMWGDLLIGQAGVLTRLTSISVSINPPKITLFAGETRRFIASVNGTDEKTVSWAVEEENGGTITDLGVYTAPTIQGVYHVTATSKANPQKKAVATVTVLTYCDPPLRPLRQ
ncbi:MAG TPA: hypothetical protein VF146_11285 [Bryobacteraceae bacterium]